MIMKIYFKVAKILRLKAIIALFFLLGFGGITQAQTDSELIKLVTDKPVYINGETVNLSWYIGRYPKIGTPFLKSFDNTRVVV